MLIILFTTIPASGNSFFSQFFDVKDGRLDMSEWLAGRTGFLPIPILISDPAVGYGGGLGLSFFHESADEPRLNQSDAEMLSLPPSVTFLAGDNIFSPGEGHLAKLHTMVYNEAFGCDYDFTKIKASSYSYWPILERVVLDVRFEGDFTDGDPPFYGVPYIDMRGIPAMRYQADHVLVGELEARWDVTYRWSLVGFGGGGMTADSVDDFGAESIKFAGGGGFRYLIARRFGLRVGLDVAVGPEDTVM